MVPTAATTCAPRAKQVLSTIIFYNMKSSLLLLLATPSYSTTVYHGNWKHREDYVQATNSNIDLLDPTVDLIFAVKQQNLQKLETTLLAVSDPASTSYGEHLTHDEVHQMTANPAASQAVKDWSNAHGLTFQASSSHDEYLTYQGNRGRWRMKDGWSLSFCPCWSVVVDTFYSLLPPVQHPCPCGTNCCTVNLLK